MNAGFRRVNGVHMGAGENILAGQAGLGGFVNKPPHAGGTRCGIPMAGGGGGGANGLGGPAVNAGFVGATSIQVGAGGACQRGRQALGGSEINLHMWGNGRRFSHGRQCSKRGCGWIGSKR